MGKGRRVRHTRCAGAAPAADRAEDIVFGPLGYLLDSADPLEAEGVGSALVALGVDGDDSPLGLEAALVVIDALTATGRAEAVAVLRGLSAVLPELLAARARRAADQLVVAGVPDVRWGSQVGRASVVAAWLVSHVVGDGENVILLCRYPDGHEHALVIHIDHDLGSPVTDAFVGPPDTLDQFRALTADEPDITIEPVPAVEAVARVRAAIDVGDRTFPPYESETWPEIRPLLEARLATVPIDGAASRRSPEPGREFVDGTLDAVDEVVGEPFDWRGVPADLRPRVEEVLAHCDRVCAEALDAEYADLARRLTAKLARKRPTPLRRGDPRIWAGGVLYALAQVNFLFDVHARPHLTGKRLAAIAGVSLSTISAKAGVVRDAVRLSVFDREFTRSDVRAALRW